MAAADLEALSSDLVVLAARLVRRVRRDQQLPAGFRILSVLDEQGALGVTALAVADRCSQPTMSAAVGELAAQDLVTKEPDPADARRSLVDLSAHGRRELNRVRAANGAAVAARLTRTGHTPEEVAAAVALLRDLLADDDPHEQEAEHA
jgi:DNA-binding MarR family transcriptional regulator